MATTLDRVQAGMDFLDERHPEWRGAINRDVLDLSSQTDCILGQLYGHYMDALLPLGLVDDKARQVALGFELNAWRSDEDYGSLTDAWYYLLTAEGER